jgi:hypothetical protein
MIPSGIPPGSFGFFRKGPIGVGYRPLAPPGTVFAVAGSLRLRVRLHKKINNVPPDLGLRRERDGGQKTRFKAAQIPSRSSVPRQNGCQQYGLLCIHLIKNDKGTASLLLPDGGGVASDATPDNAGDGTVVLISAAGTVRLLLNNHRT